MTAIDYLYVRILRIKNGRDYLRKGYNMKESYMTIKEFCERLQISQSTVYRMIKSGMIPAIKFGRYWKIPRSVFDNI